MKQLHPRAVWVFFFSRIIAWIFIGGFLAVQGAAILSNISNKSIEDFTAGSFFGWFILIFVILIIIAYIVARLTYHFYRYELTDGEYRAERGIIWKRYISIPYERIQNVDIYRGVIARLLGLSDLQIHTAGYGAAGASKLGSEGRLPGISREDAEMLRDELIRRAKQSKNQGL